MKPDGIFIFAHPDFGEDNGLFQIAFVFVPHEPEASALRRAVIGPDVAVEKGAPHADWLPCQSHVLLEVHQPVNATVHCKPNQTLPVTLAEEKWDR